MSSSHYPAVGDRMSRRNFLKLMAAAGTPFTFVPFVDWGKFLPKTSVSVAEKVKIEIRGESANIYDFPANSSEVVIYPKSDDPVLNKEAFRTWQLIRLPVEIHGDVDEVSSFRLYSIRNGDLFSVAACLRRCLLCLQVIQAQM